MKKTLYSIILLVSVFGSSCKKDNNDPKLTAIVNIVNGAIDAGTIKVAGGTEGTTFLYSTAPNIAYGTSGTFGSYPGSNTIKVVSATDTTKVLFSKTMNLQPISTLYVIGQSPSIDTIYRMETTMPYLSNYNNSDNSFYLRFVNLSPNSTPLSINIAGTATNEVSVLSYRGITAFKKYAAALAIPAVGTTPAVPATPDYVFEIRDVATNTVQATITIQPNNYRYKTVSIIIKGLLTTPATMGTNAFGAFVVSYS